MRAPILALTLLALLSAHAPAAAQRAHRDPVTRTDRFELRSDPVVGLHHFLLAWAAAEAGEWPPFAPPIEERRSWRSRLSEDEARVWRSAVEAYEGTRGRSRLFDEGLLAVREWAAGIGSRDAIPEEDRALADALEAALPVYWRRWWPEHDRKSRAWIGEVAPTVDELEEDVMPRLAEAYGGEWPEEIISVDVVAYPNPVGAYSTRGRVTISSVDPAIQMPQAVEIVFHEASHVDSMEAPLRAAIREAFATAGGEPPGPFWHDVIFYTVGDVVRRVLEERGEPGYRHYGRTSGVYARGARWREELPALEAHWRPLLRSLSSEDDVRPDRARMEALGRIAQTLLEGG